MALLIDNRVGHSLVDWKSISDRILHARILHRHSHVTIIVVYAPTEEAQSPAGEQFETAYYPWPPFVLFYNEIEFIIKLYEYKL